MQAYMSVSFRERERTAQVREKPWGETTKGRGIRRKMETGKPSVQRDGDVEGRGDG